MINLQTAESAAINEIDQTDISKPKHLEKKQVTHQY